MPRSANFALWYVSMKKPRASRWMTGRSSNTPGRDVSIRCINSDARLYAHLQQSPKVNHRTNQSEATDPDRAIARRELSRSTFRSTIGIRDCEHQQATAHDSYT